MSEAPNRSFSWTATHTPSMDKIKLLVRRIDSAVTPDFIELVRIPRFAKLLHIACYVKEDHCDASHERPLLNESDNSTNGSHEMRRH